MLKISIKRSGLEPVGYGESTTTQTPEIFIVFPKFRLRPGHDRLLHGRIERKTLEIFEFVNTLRRENFRASVTYPSKQRFSQLSEHFFESKQGCLERGPRVFLCSLHNPNTLRKFHLKTCISLCAKTSRKVLHISLLFVTFLKFVTTSRRKCAYGAIIITLLTSFCWPQFPGNLRFLQFLNMFSTRKTLSLIRKISNFIARRRRRKI